MRITNIAARATLKVPHPVHQFASIGIELEATAELDHHEDAPEAADKLHAQVLEWARVRLEVARRIEQDQIQQAAEATTEIEGMPRETVPTEPATEPPPTTRLNQPAGFTYRGREFKRAKTGPAAALRQALIDLAACRTTEDWDALRRPLDNLVLMFDELGHADKAEALALADDACGERLLAAPPEADQDDIPFDEPAKPVEPAAAPEIEPVQPGNGAAPIEADLAGLRVLLRKAMDIIGESKVRDIIEHHSGGGSKVSDLPTVGAVSAVRADVERGMKEALGL